MSDTGNGEWTRDKCSEYIQRLNAVCGGSEEAKLRRAVFAIIDTESPLYRPYYGKPEQGKEKIPGRKDATQFIKADAQDTMCRLAGHLGLLTWDNEHRELKLRAAIPEAAEFAAIRKLRVELELLGWVAVHHLKDQELKKRVLAELTATNESLLNVYDADTPKTYSHTDYRSAVAVERFWEQDLRFHQMPCEQTQFSIGAKLLHILLQRMRLSGNKRRVIFDRIPRSVKQHRALLKLVAAKPSSKSVEKLRGALEKHLSTSDKEMEIEHQDPVPQDIGDYETRFRNLLRYRFHDATEARMRTFLFAINDPSCIALAHYVKKPPTRKQVMEFVGSTTSIVRRIEAKMSGHLGILEKAPHEQMTFQAARPNDAEFAEIKKARIEIECLGWEGLAQATKDKDETITQLRLKNYAIQAIGQRLDFLNEDEDEQSRYFEEFPTLGYWAEDFWKEDSEFHMLPCIRMGLQPGAGLLQILLERMRLHAGNRFKILKRIPISFVEHEAILQAVETGDPTEVRKRVVDHLDSSEDYFNKA